MPLTKNEAIALLVKSARPSGKTATGNGNEKWCDSEGNVHYERVPRDKIGTHIGKAGGIQRTRKGATRRKLDGSRKYVAGNVISEEVLWYKL